MKASELRIGNWVLITPFKKGDELQINEKEFGNLIVFKTWDRIKPILLTEEWLLKFGFKKSGHYFLNTDSIPVFLQLFSGVYRLTDSDDSCLSVPIIYVHQIQNLYFEITGEELSV